MFTYTKISSYRRMKNQFNYFENFKDVAMYEHLKSYNYNA